MAADINSQTFELLVDTLKRIEDKVDGGFDKMNGRVRKLENWRWYVIGIAAAVALLFPLLVKVL